MSAPQGPDFLPLKGGGDSREAQRAGVSAPEPPTLYSFRRCPYAIRARMALVVSQTRFTLVEVKLAAKPEALLAASPKATVPVLVLTDGTVIDESLAIMHWALALHDPENWLSGVDEALIATNDGPFKHHLDRYKYPQRHGSDPLAHRTAAIAILAELENRYPFPLRGGQLGESRAGRGSPAPPPTPVPTFTEIALFPFIRQFAATDPAWFATQPLPALQASLAHHLASPLFAAAMAK